MDDSACLVDSAGLPASPVAAEVPPAAPALVVVCSLEVELVELDSLELELPVELGSPDVFPLVEVVLVVEVALAAAFSALVSLGGVISGVERGTVSETLAPPQAVAQKGVVRARQIASAERALTAAPCACRTWGSR